jgi:hypothetical protein
MTDSTNRQEFRADQRVQFLAAVNAAARDPAMLLSIETDADGNTVAIVHRGPLEASAVSPASRLADPDSFAHQVNQFLCSVKPERGLCGPEEFCDGQNQVQRLVTHLAFEGDQANPDITLRQAASILYFIRHMETREGCENHAAGGTAHCGFNHVLYWMEQRLLMLVAVQS